jgi:RimJ/RimL family protein N-acetyltransferase
MNPLTLEIPDRIETDRLSIFAHTQESAPQVNQAVVESLPELIDWMPWAKTPQTLEETLKFCRSAQARFLLREAFLYRMCLKNTDTVIGSCGAFRINWDIPKCEIGYWCRTSYSGKGLMTEGIAGIVAMLRQTLHMKRIEIRADARNKRSRALAERLSFTLEGIMRKDAMGNDGNPYDASVYALVD